MKRWRGAITFSGAAAVAVLVFARLFAWRDAVALSSLAVTALGFFVALWQIARSTRAVEAAKDAVERTEKRLAGNHLLLMLPEIEQAERALDAAAMGSDVTAVANALVTWRRVCSELLGIVRLMPEPDHKLLISLLEKSAETAGHAKSSVIDGKQSDLATATSRVRGLATKVCAQLSSLGSGMRASGST